MSKILFLKVFIYVYCVICRSYLPVDAPTIVDVTTIVAHNCTNVLFLVSLQDINMRKPFKSSIIKEQQVVTKTTRPQSVMLMYQHYCEPAPALHILNPYRFVACVFSFLLSVDDCLGCSGSEFTGYFSVCLSAQVFTIYYLCHVNRVNGGDAVFV